MKKILFVSNTANFSKFNKPYMKWCTENGWQVDYCAPNDEIVTDCENHIVLPIPRSPFSKGIFKCIKDLRKILEKEQYDIIHCHTPMGAVIARLAAKKLYKQNKVKVIYTAHGFHFYKGAPLVNWLLYYPVERYLSKYTDVLITINNEDYEFAKKKLKAKKICFSNGVGINFENFKPSENASDKFNLRYKNGFNQNDFIILYIAEFIPRKNHKLIFEILPVLASEIENLKIVLLGKGELLEYYKNWVNENKFNNIVKFTGYVKNVNEYCNMSDVLLMPSFQEGLPISMIEAISIGLPVVASKIRGHVDVIESERNGFLCDLSDSKSFENAIMKLYRDLNLRKEISENNKERAKVFSIDRVISNTTDYYTLE